MSDVTCWRETWEDFDQCIWHADTDDKPRDELIQARTDKPEVLDGAIIRGSNLGSSISFANCRLNGAELTKAHCSMADFSDSKLRYAILKDSYFFKTSFPRTNLREARLQNVNLQEAIFTKAELVGISISDAIVHRADFSDVLMYESVLHESDFRNSTFNDADLRNADLTGSDLRFATAVDTYLEDADMTDVTARETNFEAAMFENALFTRTDIREANLSGADLYQAQFSNPRINSETEFGDTCSYEAENKSPEIASGTSPLVAATWVYRRLENLHEKNALADSTRQYHISKQEAQRKLDYRNENYGRYAVATLNRYLTNHGESIQRLLSAWIITIVGAGILYPFVGGIFDDGTLYRLRLTAEWPTIASLIEVGDVILRGLYFSIITFTTIGYANVAPNGVGSRILVGIESLFGGILIALFVYVLGRRVGR
ncbi:pentapeptide repeat-containing protein [Halogranum rubrum]|uniref:pentapeptide repeat-containing protein n=1 Tax=Halogranum rubrum TaxID=553466 RepID=UPI00145F5B88|nr:pentapeptide repeat-containing protein [Halogranum salarium]